MLKVYMFSLKLNVKILKVDVEVKFLMTGWNTKTIFFSNSLEIKLNFLVVQSPQVTN